MPCISRQTQPRKQRNACLGIGDQALQAPGARKSQPRGRNG